ncbi:glycosyltransferase family 4 protein (plasmid) [Pedobacter sp. BS3]|uniref:glycosyltransferase family 4 protein n=1 Tax=Pedobacter sp. BS3 TaxID=2567937 RepID=UPI0011F09130|nr:glycosyltransferase family 4 protein [Pedobacter sp. BS3]TZF86208.1 glycosyltransferase family 4 protein [Pedobacter sp. BS3]
MKGIIANPNIAPYITQSVLAYQEAGSLEGFYTRFCYHHAHALSTFMASLSLRIKRELKRRQVPELNPKLIRQSPFPELLRVFSARYAPAGLSDKLWEWSELGFDHWVSGELHAGLDFVHTYEHAALMTLQTAKRLGILSIYEQPSQHHAFFDSIVKEQLRQYPELGDSTTRLLYDENAIRRNTRRDEELQTADIILCNSTFTRHTLEEAGVAGDKIICIPYGFPDALTAKPEKTRTRIRFLYAGNLSLRKGVHILLQAWKTAGLAEAELFLVGKYLLPDFFRQDLPENVHFIENLPQPEYFHILQQADAFILPTLADGFGMVISEAISMGIPVITTTNSGGPDIIRPYQDGILIPPGDKEAIVQALTWCYNHPEKLQTMGINALKQAQAYPWSTYRKRLVSEVKGKVEDKVRR